MTLKAELVGHSWMESLLVGNDGAEMAAVVGVADVLSAPELLDEPPPPPPQAPNPKNIKRIESRPQLFDLIFLLYSRNNIN